MHALGIFFPVHVSNLLFQAGFTLKVHKNENLASILNFVLFQCYLCINNKILVNIFFD